MSELDDAEAGFTLIELMVVLLIIAILLAIAIPTFLGVTSSANDRAAQSNLTNALTEVQAQYQATGQSYSGIAVAVSSSAPEYTWTAATSACTTTTANCISIQPIDVGTANDAQGVVIANMSKTGTCWWVAQLQTTPATIASGETTGNFSFIASSTAGTTGFRSYPAVTGSTQVNTSVLQAGTYYAKTTVGSTPVGGSKFTASECTANYAVSLTTPKTAGNFNWGSSFSAAGQGG
ncbi:MAG TPA: prepilin-type N-terminal cleavage/methylation domain-containing protein [Acidimicrobiales bacterium]